MAGWSGVEFAKKVNTNDKLYADGLAMNYLYPVADSVYCALKQILVRFGNSGLNYRNGANAN